MNSPTPENLPDSSHDDVQSFVTSAQEKASDTLDVSKDYIRENPLIVALGAFVLGVLIGLLCRSHETERREPSRVARDFADDIFAQISDRLPHLRLKKPCCPASSLLKNCGKKFQQLVK